MKLLAYFVVGFTAGTVAWLLKWLLLALIDAWGATALFRTSTTRPAKPAPVAVRQRPALRPHHRLWRAP